MSEAVLERGRCGGCRWFRRSMSEALSVGECRCDAGAFFGLEVRAEYLGCTVFEAGPPMCRGVGRIT